MRASKDPVIAALRRYPASQFAVTVGDDIKVLPLSTKANKWELLLETLNALRWTSIEAQDEKGRTLGAIDREAEDDEDGVPEDSVDQAGRFAELIVRVVEKCMASSERVMKSAVEALERQGAGMASAMGAMEKGYSSMGEGYQSAIKLSAMTAASGGDADDPVVKMMGMHMMQQMMGGQRPTPPATTPPTPTTPPKPAEKVADVKARARPKAA